MAFSLTNSGSIPNLSSSPFQSTSYQKNVSGISTATPTSPQNSGLVNAGNSTLLGGTPIKQGYLPPIPAPSTPVKKITTPDGSTTEFHAPQLKENEVNFARPGQTPDIRVNGQPTGSQGSTGASTGTSVNAGLYQNPSATNSQNTVQTADASGNPVAPAPSTQVNPDGSPISQANAYQNAGAQTPNETMAQNRLYQDGQGNAQMRADNLRKSQLLNSQQVGQLAPFAEADQFNVNNPNSRPDLNAPDLVGRAAGEQSLYNNLSGLGYEGAVNAYNGDLQAMGNTIGADESAYSGAQTQAQRQSEAQKNIFSSSIPSQITPGNALYNPLTQQGVGGSLGDLSSRSAVGANAELVKPYLDDLNTSKATIQTIGNTENLLNNFLSKAGDAVNATQSTDINALVKNLGGRLSNADVTNFNNLVGSLRSQYAAYLGARGGMNPTQSGEQAKNQIPEDASINTIKSVLSTLKNESNINLQTAQDKYNNALSGVNGGGNSSFGTSSNSNNSSRSGIGAGWRGN